MKRRRIAKDCCSTEPSSISSYTVDSIITIDGRGQTVLPKELREKAGIQPGDKLAVTILEKDGKVCCINLIKLNDLAGILKERLGPVMKELA